MPHGNQSESECLLGGKIGKIGKIPGILRVYLKKPGYTRVISALLHGFAPGTTPTAATTNENPAYHFRIPLYHTTPKLIKISPNTSLIPVKFEHCFLVVGISQILDFSRRVTIVIKRPCCELVHQEWLTTARSHTVASCDERGLACAAHTDVVYIHICGHVSAGSGHEIRIFPRRSQGGPVHTLTWA